MAEICKELYMKLHKKQNNFEKYNNIRSVLRWGNKKKESSPYLSFVIPTYHREGELEEAIKSILVQKEIVSFEIVVVDNSTDLSDSNKTFELIKRINSPLLLYYVNENNLGQAGNWNRCFSLARGKYVAILHDDDLLKEDYLEQMVKCISVAERFARPVGMIRPLFKDFTNSKDLPVINNVNRGGIRRFYRLNALAIDGIGPSGCPTCGMIFNREAVIEIGGFDSDFYPSHDYVLGYMLIRGGYNAFITEDYLGYYRVAFNASMDKEVLKNYCKCDFYFREYLYSENLFNALFGLLFRNVQYTLSVDGTKELAERFGQKMTIDEISFRKGYGEHHIKKKLYLAQRDILCKILYKIYAKDEINTYKKRGGSIKMSSFKKMIKKILLGISPVYKKLDAVQKDIWIIKDNTNPLFSQPKTGARDHNHTFIDRKKDYDKVLIILAGYKEEIWDITLERIHRFLPVGIDVCVVTSGLDNDELRTLCKRNEWSYLATKENCITLAQNIAIKYFPSAEWIYKIDEDMFITDNFFDNMLKTYEMAQSDKYVPAFVAPLIPINGYGYVKILTELGLVDEWEKRFGKLVYTDALYHNKNILLSSDAAKFLWGESCEELKSIDKLNEHFCHSTAQYSICPFRFSIGAVLFKRKTWEDWGEFPVPSEGNGLGLDETTMCYSSIQQAKAIIISNNCVVGHLGFGPQTKEMTKFYLANKKQFEIANS